MPWCTSNVCSMTPIMRSPRNCPPVLRARSTTTRPARAPWRQRPIAPVPAPAEIRQRPTGSSVRLLFGSCFALILAAAVGLGATWLTITRGVAFGSLTIGAWKAWPKSGSVDIDPYARATIARTGELPLGTGDGVAFYARTDDAGINLDGRCTITVSGVTTAARYWTLTLGDPEGRQRANTIDHDGFTSGEVVRDIEGRFTISGAPRARPGNWLPTDGIERYILVWRFVP